MSLTLGKMARIWNSNSLFYHRNTKECELKTDSVTQWNFQNSEKQSMVYSNQMNAQSRKQWLKTWEEGFVTFELSLVLPSSPAWGWFWRWGPIFQVWSPDFGKSRVGLVPKKFCFSVLTLRSFPEDWNRILLLFLFTWNSLRTQKWLSIELSSKTLKGKQAAASTGKD